MGLRTCVAVDVVQVVQLPKGKYSKKNTSSFCRPSQTLPYLMHPFVEVQNVILWIFFQIRRESVAVLYFTIEELPGLRRSPHQSGTAVGGHLRCIQLWERNKLYENIKGVIPIPTSFFVATREGILQRGSKGIKRWISYAKSANAAKSQAKMEIQRLVAAMQRHDGTIHGGREDQCIQRFRFRQIAGQVDLDPLTLTSTKWLTTCKQL